MSLNFKARSLDGKLQRQRFPLHPSRSPVIGRPHPSPIVTPTRLQLVARLSVHTWTSVATRDREC